MYTQDDLKTVQEQYRKRWLWLVLGLLLPTAGLVWSLVVRLQPLTIGLSILTGCIFVFVHGVAISPVGAYRKHLSELLQGRNREMEGTFKGFDSRYAVRDRVRFLPLMLNVGDPQEPNDDRLLYWDLNLPLPDWHEGEQLYIASFDKAVTAWRRL